MLKFRVINPINYPSSDLYGVSWVWPRATTQLHMPEIPHLGVAQEHIETYERDKSKRIKVMWS